MKNSTSCHLSLYRHFSATSTIMGPSLYTGTLNSKRTIRGVFLWHTSVQLCILIKDSGWADGIHARLGTSCNYSRRVRDTQLHRRWGCRCCCLDGWQIKSPRTDNRNTLNSTRIYVQTCWVSSGIQNQDVSWIRMGIWEGGSTWLVSTYLKQRVYVTVFDRKLLIFLLYLAIS